MDWNDIDAVVLGKTPDIFDGHYTPASRPPISSRQASSKKCSPSPMQRSQRATSTGL
jgi:hypothetical protein